MSSYAVLARCRSTLAAGSIALILPVSALAVDAAPPEALSVKVFPDRYVAAGKPFSDLAALEAWATTIRIRTVWLDGCGPASTKQLLAAVERFHRVYVEGVQVRTFALEESGCLAPAAERVSFGVDEVARLPSAREYQATDQRGRGVMP